MGKYLLGLDAGNTVIKAVLFDLTGHQIASAEENGASLSPQPGHVERDLVGLWGQAGTAIKKCIVEAAIDPAGIVGIGCAGHGNGLYLLDQEEQPLVAIQSLDARAVKTAERLSADGNADRLQSLCLQRPWPSQTPTLLAWIKQNDPDLYERIGTVFLCKDFVTFKLTGKRSTDVTDMSGCGFLKLPENTYSSDILEAYGLADAAPLLPPLYQSANVVGTVTAEAASHTGLSEGTPVVGGVFDVVASALGSGTVDTGQASIIAGTWSINQVVVSEPVVDSDIFMASAFDDNRFLEIEASATSAVNLEWFVHELMKTDSDALETSGSSIFDLCNKLVQSVEYTLDLPFFHPYIYGGATSGNTRGGFYGLSGGHGRAHMLYGLFEGVVFGHRQHVEKLRRNGIKIENVILSGGGSRSPVWPQMFADILGVEVSVAEARETGALGAAITAGIGTGILSGYRSGVQQMTNIVQTFMPDPAKSKFYETRYSLFLDIGTAMETVWSRLEKETLSL